MRQICILGNSHVAALKLGLDSYREEGMFADCSIDIFGFRIRKSSLVQVQQGHVQSHRGRPETSFDFHTGPSSLRLDSYDEIYFTVGTRPSSFPHFNPRFVLNFVHSDRSMRPLSQALVTRIVQHTVLEQWFSPLLQDMIHESSRPLVHFLGCPFWSTLDHRAQALTARLDSDEGAGAALARLQQQIETAVKAQETDRLRLPPPPPSTLDGYGAFTRHEFCTDSKRMSEDFEIGHGPRDFRHMNADYGREFLRNIRLEATSITSSASPPASTTSALPSKV